MFSLVVSRQCYVVWMGCEVGRGEGSKWIVDKKPQSSCNTGEPSWKLPMFFRVWAGRYRCTLSFLMLAVLSAVNRSSDEHEVLTFNRNVLPAYYGLLRLCCEYSRAFTRQLAVHSNMKWAFENLTPRVNHYPQVQI